MGIRTTGVPALAFGLASRFASGGSEPNVISFSIIEAPSVLGLFPKGVETLPEALLDAGLAERLGAARFGRIEPPPYDPRRDAATKLLNPQGIADYSRALANAVARARGEGKFPVVLGGDCSILLGCMLAMRRDRHAGLLFLDGHADFYQPEAEPNGEAASMELALATGRGPEIVTDLEGLCPLVRDEDVVALGIRDAELAETHGSQRIEDTGIEVIDFAAFRRIGAAAAAQKVLTRLEKADLDGFWIHLDADVLDDAVMPAVDYRLPGGLQWNELSAVLRTAIRSGRALGIDITIFNPKLDATGEIGRSFVDTVVAGLASDAR
jgi:arginase